ncbi:MAG: FAD-binding protein [Deltaproteobacteria bacterium]|nr:FAD-binding protein [Deltaproteobacteria bacterium]
MAGMRPTSRDELVELVKHAEAEGVTVRAVGSDRSFSPVAATSGIRVDTFGLDRVLEIDPETLRDPSLADGLARVEAGILMYRVNRHLEALGKSLENMGAFAGQTLAGTVSTGSHGTGFEFGPICDIVVSLQLVASGGRVLQIEPTDGITDPERFREEGVELVQDDDRFYSVVVAMGCMGLIYSMTIRVLPLFYLEESRLMHRWEPVRADLEDGHLFKENRHCNILINPYHRKHGVVCNVAVRNASDPPGVVQRLIPRQNVMPYVAARIGFVRLLVAGMHRWPDAVTTWMHKTILDLIVRKHACHVAHRILDAGPLNTAHEAHALEVAVPIERRMEAVDTVVDLAQQRRQQGRYLTGPISIRFVKASPHYLSPNHGRDACMIEVISLCDTPWGREELEPYLHALRPLGARSNWGLELFGLDGSDARWRADYPKYPLWLATYRELNASGVFSNRFTRACGFDQPVESDRSVQHG